MHHAVIRDAVRQRLVELHGEPPDTLLRDELGLCLGATRADVAAVNGHIVGCEIKGAQDRLSRLEGQVDLYGRVVDEAVLVVEGKHTGRAVDLLPDWWGVWVAEDVDGAAVLHEARPASRNPAVDPLAVAQLLWRDEVYGLLEQHGGTARLSKATRWQLWEQLVERLPLEDLQRVVREGLRARREW